MKKAVRIIFLLIGGIFLSPIFLFSSPKIPAAAFSRKNFSFSEYYRRHNSYDNDFSIPGGWVFTPSAIFSYVNYLPQPGRLTVSFPYKLTDNSNVVTTQQFSAASDNLVGTGKWVYPSVGLELGKENFTVEAQMGWYINYWSDNLYGGINYRFILKKAHRSPHQL